MIASFVFSGLDRVHYHELINPEYLYHKESFLIKGKYQFL